ncbi:MAG: NTP transferase domain-containing protein [Candidatus Marinimicrobia bacterium]|nr:NTP transferase domain-containing protein [Candidatus Neomarinimicrobiota bacterium]
MRSHTPKVLHRIAGKEILRWVMDAVQVPKPDAAFIVVGPDGPDAQGPLMNGATLLVQRERLGTGHALKQARSHLQGRVDNIMVVNGDIPLISGRTLQRMMDHHLESEANLTLLTCRVDDPGELGRIVRNSQGRVTRIIEHREAGPQHLDISEICCGAYCFRDEWLWPELEGLEAHESGEYRLCGHQGHRGAGGSEAQRANPEPEVGGQRETRQ